MTRLLRLGALAALGLGAAGCVFIGDDDEPATREQIIEAASRCGVPDFQPTRAGDGWAAPVDPGVPDHQAREDCIYEDLTRHAQIAER